MSSAPGTDVNEESAPSTPKNVPQLTAFSFPPQPQEPNTQLISALRDNRSAHALVAKACFVLTQYAGHCSSEDSNSVLLHDSSYIKTVSNSFQALLDCLANHTDRRCRSMAAATVALLGRSAYARVRPLPNLMAQREPSKNRLEDEIGTDVPAALATCALEDDDDGVSAAAFQALASMVCNNHTDPLTQEIRAIGFSSCSPYAPTLRACLEEDPIIPLVELELRILANVVAPRLLQLMERCIRFKSSRHQGLALPLLTASVIYQAQTTPAVFSVTDRTTYSKRWTELDVQGFCSTLTDHLILPALEHSLDGALSRTAALCGIRLLAVVQNTHLARWSARVLKEDALYTELDVDAKIAGLSAQLIALRGVPLTERTLVLIPLAEQVAQLPTTTTAPIGASIAGIRVRWNGSTIYRRPARIGLWTEIALSFFLDGPTDMKTRSDCLKAFLGSATLAKIQGAAPDNSLTTCRDELLLAFTSTAIDTGRRFRIAPDGALKLNGDPRRDPQFPEWLRLAWVVLTSFVSCVLTGPKVAYLQEDLSITTAGLASYTQLCQEYLYSVGLFQPACSAATKLTTNACPPHILWDQLMESAALLAKFDSYDQGLLEQTTKLMDEILAREKSHGIPSHHMRLFMIAMASDHWVQGRIAAIRSHLDGTGITPLTLAVNSGRDIIVACSPKRLLNKIFSSHVPDKNTKRDPIKKLAQETVRMAVACIENIALAAIDWRKRFGSSNDSKQLVSTAVGILQGKLDDIPVDESMSTIMSPLCDAAISRIQVHFENDSSHGDDQYFPLSELVTQPLKTKIKPLISSTRPPPCPKDEFMLGYYMQICRQVCATRVLQAVGAVGEAARISSVHRLSVPPIPESRDGRSLGNYGAPLAVWDAGKTVMNAAAPSDPTQILLSVNPQRVLRYDGEDEFCLSLSMRVFNMTAVDFPEGLRLEIGISTSLVEEDDVLSKQFADSLNSTPAAISAVAPLLASAVVYKGEMKSGEFLTWEILLSHEISDHCAVDLRPCVVYRNVPVESGDVGTTWVGQKGGLDDVEDASSIAGSKAGEDDFQVKAASNGRGGKGEGSKDETENIRFHGACLSLPPLLILKPCPLVFFRDRWGDYEIFRFLWFRMPFHLCAMRLIKTSSLTSSDRTSQRIAAMARLTWPGEAIPGGFAAKAWAFMTLSGDHVLCVYAESDSNSTPGKQALYFRAESKSSLFALVGTEFARSSVVSAMIPGFIAS